MSNGNEMMHALENYALENYGHFLNNLSVNIEVGTREHLKKQISTRYHMDVSNKFFLINRSKMSIRSHDFHEYTCKPHVQQDFHSCNVLCHTN